jgi:hypothetical protein
MAMKIKNIFALVSGLDMFAERLGISGERLLSFLSVLDSEFFECLLLKPEQMQDETLGLAKEYCAMMEKFWGQQFDHSPFINSLPVPCDASLADADLRELPAVVRYV